ncbi:cupredoxin domain-containing protein [Halomonas sp. V046]|uniref:cupredoxin domain-containing protein n=1 Tax=Halomonas sp. V046 TaxID=3459611 RepID=UPI004044AA16
MRKMLLAVLLGLAATPALAGAGHAGSGHADSQAGEGEVDRTIAFEAGDMWFDPEALAVAPGDTVAFEITNTGQLTHEFVIGAAEDQQAHREMMREMAGGDAGDMGHDMAAGHHGDQGGHGMDMPALTLAPGETGTLVWTAPSGAESLIYACNIPGHFESGMKGQIRIGQPDANRAIVLEDSSRRE